MIKSRTWAVLSALLYGSSLTSASANSIDISFRIGEGELINTRHTHLSSSPTDLPSSHYLKLASVCFIADTEECGGFLFSNTEDLDGGGTPDNYNPDNTNRCQKEGYTVTSCPEGYKLGGKKCPYGNYYTECVPSCPSNYVECNEPYVPYVGVGEACDGKYASCTCTPCSSEYSYTSIPNGYLQDGEGCLDCDGQTKYKVKINPCDGFMDCGNMGGASGANSCQSGNTIKYDNCKPCPNLGTLTSCPRSSVCTYEDCSGLWYVTGCKAGYTDYCDYCAM